MTETISGVLLVIAFVGVAGLATVLCMTAWKRAGARETSRDQRLG